MEPNSVAKNPDQSSSDLTVASDGFGKIGDVVESSGNIVGENTLKLATSVHLHEPCPVTDITNIKPVRKRKQIKIESDIPVKITRDYLKINIRVTRASSKLDIQKK